MDSDYIELRCRSAFSFLRGASLPEGLIARAAALGSATIACGDDDGVYGAPRFYHAAQQAGMRAIVGCNLRLGGDDKGGGAGRGGELYLLVVNATGYRNLCRLVTHFKMVRCQGRGEGELGGFGGAE